MNDNQKNKNSNNEPKKVTGLEPSKKNLINGIILGIVCIILIVLFIFTAFRGILSDEAQNIVDWIMPGALLLGGAYLIFVNTIDKSSIKKSRPMFIGGIVCCVIALGAYILKIVGAIG